MIKSGTVVDHADLDSFFGKADGAPPPATEKAGNSNVVLDEDDFDLLSPEFTFQRNTKLTNPKKSLAKIRPQTKRPRYGQVL